MSEATGLAAGVHWAERADDEAIAQHLMQLISAPGAHRLAVPGGRTPFPIFELLARQELPWDRVSLILTDDRIVPADHPASNQGKLEQAFAGTAARIIALEDGADVAPFDMVWLGMGTDGHIASLFPNMEVQLNGSPRIERTIPDPLPPEAPFERLSLNLAALVATQEIMLVIRGEEKRRVIEQAIAGEHDLPIARLLDAAHCPVTIYWSEG